MLDEKLQNTIDSPEKNQTEEPVQQNKNDSRGFIDNLRINKKLLLFFIAGLVVLVPLIVFSASFFFSSSKNSLSPTPPVVQPTAFPIKELPTPTPNESKQATEIKTQVKPQLDKIIQVKYEVSRIKVYNETWALLQVTNPETDPGNVLLKKDSGSWKILLGPQTYFSDEELTNVGAPQEIKDVINSAGF